MQHEKKKVLFLCNRNSARSQMAEGILRAMYGDRYDVYSAGAGAATIDPRAVAVMREAGIDISGQRSKSAAEFRDSIFDLAATLCETAKQSCPVCSTNLTKLQGLAGIPRAREVIHRGFKDPAAAAGSKDEQMEAFRRVRDQLMDWISQTFR